MAEWVKLGIIAGGGELPVALAEHCKAEARAYCVARILPFADAALDAHPGASHDLGAMGARIAFLKAEGCDAIVFVGNVPKPDFASLQWDEAGLAMLPQFRQAAQVGDDELLRAVVIAHAQAGFRIIGAEEVFAELRGPAGVLSARGPTASERTDVKKAAAIASAIGALDIGQGAVVCDGVVLGVEAQEGTDALLARIATLPEAIRGTLQQRRGVLVKRPKPMQERRIDLPTLGVQTIERAAAAGLAGVAFEAGGALIVRRADVIAAADRHGMFFYGFTREDLDET
jgi:DUF1009 family protein